MKEEQFYAWLLLDDETHFTRKLISLSNLELEALMMRFERNPELEFFLVRLSFKQGLKQVTKSFKTSFRPDTINAGVLELDGLNQMQIASDRRITTFLNDFLKEFLSISNILFEESVSIPDLMKSYQLCTLEATNQTQVGQYKKLRHELEIGKKNQKLRDDLELDQIKKRR